MALYGAPVSHPPLPQRNPLLGRTTESYGSGAPAGLPMPPMAPANSPAMHDRGQPGMDNISHPPNTSFHHYGGGQPDVQQQLQDLLVRLRGGGLPLQGEGMPGQERKILLGRLPLQGEGMEPGRDGQRLLGGLPTAGERRPLSDLLMALGS